MAEIRFEKVMKLFGNTKVVNDLTLTIHDGEFFTFVGPSGCGKSTLLNLVAGLEEVTSGDILFDDKPVNDLPPKDRDVAMVFQSYALYPHMSVYENIAFPLRMKKEKVEVIQREVVRVASLLGLAELQTRKPRELSGGQRQRVALGRAMVRKPRVFLMDEPLSNLDARLRIETRAELKKLHRELGITTLYVTHDQAEALGLSDRIAVLKEGVVQQVGTPREIHQKPANTFVAGFIGSPSMNFLRCAVRKDRPLEADCNGTVLSFPAGGAAPSGEVLIGMRPEDMVVEAGKRVGSVEVTVSVIEPAGSFNWVDVEWRGAPLKAMSKLEEELLAGNEAYLSFAPDRISVFDAASGVRLE